MDRRAARGEVGEPGVRKGGEEFAATVEDGANDR
jgi:hypothetical protein